MSDTRPVPKFAVGESVYILSYNIDPGQWIPAVVASLEYWPESFEFPIGRKFPSGWTYHCVGISWSHEKDVRKRYPPADKEFTEDLLNTLNIVKTGSRELCNS